jgi:16S rRNA (guanine527-N7)-methyltransferase
VKHPREDLESLQSVAEALGLSLPTARAEQLLGYARLLETRGVGLGLVSRGDAPRILGRHVLDCLRSAAIVGTARTAYDLGSGGGLPGLVVAIAVPELAVDLVETRRRRVSFLELAIDELGVSNARAVPIRVEELTAQADLCFARAFAPLAETWAAAGQLLTPGGRLVYFAGGVPANSDLPPGSRLVEVRTTPVLESSGPLVIMAQQ